MSTGMSVVSKDTVMKEIFADPEFFADLFNGNFFEGNQVIKPEELITEDSASQCSFQWDEEVVEIKRIRDLIKKSTASGSYALLAVENQSTIDKYMPLRCLVYDVCSYLKQLKLNKMEASQEAEKNRFKELTPVFTIVLYCGERRWKGPLCLSDCFNIPEQFKSLFQDYRIMVVDMGAKEHAPYRNKLMNELFELTHLLEEGNKEEFDQIFEEERYSFEALEMAGLISGSNEIKEWMRMQKKEGKPMCENVKRWIREWKEEGRLEGKAEGKVEGRLEGKLEGKLEVVRQMLEDNFSIELISKYTDLSADEIYKYVQ